MYLHSLLKKLADIKKELVVITQHVSHDPLFVHDNLYHAKSAFHSLLDQVNTPVTQQNRQGVEGLTI